MNNENFKKNKFKVYFLVAIIFVAFFGVMMSKNNENTKVNTNPDPIENIDSENTGNDDEAVFCTMDAKICPDGSAVARVAPDCEFAPCSGEDGEEESVFDNVRMNNAIQDYLLSQEEFAWSTIEGSVNFCDLLNLNEENSSFPQEVIASCREYQLKDGGIMELSGVTIPVKVYHPNDVSCCDISLMSHEAPRDGDDYQADIDRIFSIEAREIIQNEILQGDKSLGQDFGARQQALEYFYTADDWLNVKNAILQCEVDAVWQAHSREVKVDLKDDSSLYAIEPAIDDILEVAYEAHSVCGDIRIGTE